ncbi:putative membrane protein [Aminobacter niigataensis]|uniref:Membrane protein n=1 Tax=Aminobacter niigataensis TaxID=83265 RepID=A0ABR6L693_9HYPH|nr:urate hydroxylase PuuD [Aminobacter niigataensis]MBB4652322.1 putative membrane protein [Aminobacter niigataensis]
MENYIAEWLHLVLRWFHVVAAITWVGSSFYFNKIDRSFRPPEPPVDGVSGQLWSIHGGAIYNYSRYPLGPGYVPGQLKWSKWESLGTWMSGALLLAVVYWYGASLNLVSGSADALSPVLAICVSIFSIVFGWIAYDVICKQINDERILFAVLGVLLSGAVWAFFQIFSGKAAFLHVGIVMGTIMAGNVWFVILPGQKRMLKAMADGTIAQFDVGAEAKKRNYHNNYLTLPVVFAMIGAHFPMVYGHELGWLAFILISAAGVSVRYFFNTMHAGEARPIYIAFGAALILATMFMIAPTPRSVVSGETPTVTYSQVADILTQRCVACHAADPSKAGFVEAPPKGLILDAAPSAVKAAQLVYQQAVQTHVMPPGNVTEMTDDERELLRQWIEGGAKAE